MVYCRVEPGSNLVITAHIIHYKYYNSKLILNILPRVFNSLKIMIMDIHLLNNKREKGKLTLNTYYKIISILIFHMIIHSTLMCYDTLVKKH